MAAEQNSNVPLSYVVTVPSASLNIEPGKYEVTVNLVTAISTTANASFDKYVSIFTKRISDKAAEVFGENQTHTTIPKST
jgi:hypothetical protein